MALHKICKKHGIPTPPLGWWAKKAAGKAVAQTPLPKAAASAADKITIAGDNFSREASSLADAREKARILASETVDDQGVPDPVVDCTIAKLRKAKPSEKGIVTTDTAGLIKCEIAVVSIDRLAVILPRIVAAAKLQDFRLVARENGARFEVSDRERKLYHF